jgi:16S rRNA (cytosine967-C5)-methyltransferase
VGGRRHVSPARRVACDVLLQVETRGHWAGELLRRTARQLEPADAALATELVFGVLRWQRWLDFLLGKLARRPTAQLDLPLRIVLRVGLYQLLFLDRIPAHAAVYEAVELARRMGRASAAGLVNAVLRAALRADLAGRDRATWLPDGLSEVSRLGLLFSHPDWLVERWLQYFGRARTERLLAFNNTPAPLSCTLLEPAQAQTAFVEERFRIVPGELMQTAVRVQGGPLLRSKAFRRGWILIQDEASQAVAWLVGSTHGMRLLDLCAAPGNKTAVLVRLLGPPALAVAADRRLARLRAMRGLLRRVGAGTVHLVALDATRPLPFGQAFERVLADVPCSGTGTLARNPEIRWHLHPGDLPVLAARQRAILENAVQLLAPGGRLIYSTCSLEAEENEQVIETILAAHPGLRLVSDAVQGLETVLQPPWVPEALRDTRGYFRTFPPETGTDGFFAAVLERR